MRDASEQDAFESSFGDRVRSAMGTTAQKVIAKRADVSENSMSNYLKGRVPAFDIGVRLAKALGVDPVWLATGRGSPNAAASGYLSVPIYDLRLAAGSGMFQDAAEQIGEMPVDMGLLRELGRTNTEGLGGFIAEGDSMWPKISDGARVIVDLKDTRLRESVFAFRTGDELRIKRLKRLVDGIQIISDNDVYPPELVTGDAADELTIIGRLLITVNVL